MMKGLDRWQWKKDNAYRTGQDRTGQDRTGLIVLLEEET